MATMAMKPAPGQAALTKRIFVKLMPLLTLVYIISFLDRTNIGLAKQRLEVDLGITAAAYGLGAGLFFLAYAVLEIPSNLIMHKVGARVWITRIMITWGLISAAMAFVVNDVSFYIMRILLGAAEAGLFPGVMLYLTYWFGKEDRAKANGYFILGACIASVVGGPIGGLLLQMDGFGGLHGWQWMFIVEGLPAALLSIVVWKKLPNRPADATWLTPAEAEDITSRLAAEQDDAVAHSGTHSFLGIFKDKVVLVAIFVNLAHQISLYSVTYFLPGVIAQAGKLDPWLVGTLAAVPWLFGGLGILFITPKASKPERMQRAVMIGLAAMIAGTTLGVLGGPFLGLIGFALAGLFWFVIQPIMFNVPGTRLNGVTLATGLALMNTIGITGGFFGPTIMGFTEQATGNALAGLWFSVGLLVIALLLAPIMRLSRRSPDLTEAGEPAA